MRSGLVFVSFLLAAALRAADSGVSAGAPHRYVPDGRSATPSVVAVASEGRFSELEKGRVVGVGASPATPRDLVVFEDPYPATDRP
jgi:hypothetical protein